MQLLPQPNFRTFYYPLNLVYTVPHYILQCRVYFWGKRVPGGGGRINWYDRNQSREKLGWEKPFTAYEKPVGHLIHCSHSHLCRSSSLCPPFLGETPQVGLQRLTGTRPITYQERRGGANCRPPSLAPGLQEAATVKHLLLM